MRRHRVFDVKHDAASQTATELLAPLQQEFGVKLFGPIIGPVSYPANMQEGLGHAISSLYWTLDTFLIGLFNKVQIDIDLAAFLGAAATVRHASRNMMLRTTLASLEGVLRTYRAYDSPAIVARPAAQLELITLFNQLVEDSAYVAASKQASALGIPGRLHRALVLLRRACERVLRRPTYRKTLDLGSRVVEAATHVPVPDSEVAEQLLAQGRGFLPPVVRVRTHIVNAIKAWEHAFPERTSDWVIPYSDDRAR
jgi:hypothetical protein